MTSAKTERTTSDMQTRVFIYFILSGSVGVIQLKYHDQLPLLGERAGVRAHYLEDAPSISFTQYKYDKG